MLFQTLILEKLYEKTNILSIVMIINKVTVIAVTIWAYLWLFLFLPTGGEWEIYEINWYMWWFSRIKCCGEKNIKKVGKKCWKMLIYVLKCKCLVREESCIYEEWSVT